MILFDFHFTKTLKISLFQWFREYSVVEVAMIVGFDDPNYFSRVFKTYLGQSPTQYICVQEEAHNEMHGF